MKQILNAFRKEKTYIKFVKDFVSRKGEKFPMLVSGLSEGASCAFYASIVHDIKRKDSVLLCLLPSEKEVSHLAFALEDYGIHAMTYTLRDMVFQNITASHEFEHERIATLDAIVNHTCDIVLTTPDAALQYTMPKETLVSLCRTVSTNSTYDLDELCQYLTSCGYVSCDMVDSVGQFSRRGGILDIYPPNLQNPVRIEFFDIEIDRMNYFDVITQRYLDDVDEFYITPVREIVMTDKIKKLLCDKIRSHAAKTKDAQIRDLLYQEVETLSSGRELASVDKYISFIYPQNSCLLDYFDRTDTLIVSEYSQVFNRLKAFCWQEEENAKNLMANGIVLSDFCNYAAPQNTLESFVRNSPSIILNSFVASMGTIKLDGVFSFTSQATTNCFDNLPILYEEIYRFSELGYTVYITTEGTQAAKNLIGMLNEGQYRATLDLNDSNFTIYITPKPRIVGFDLPLSRLAVISTTRGINSANVGVKKGRRAGAKKIAGEKIFSYTDLDEGDFVVHEKYGIGQYIGTKSLLVEGARKDFVQIKYAGTDVLYLPCNQLDTIAKYIGGGDESTIRLSKMGGQEWTRSKTKVKAAAKEMAKELIKLYAARIKRPGHAFPPDSSMEREFADNFEYQETDGQLAAIRDITLDMEASHPMDRLLCGDVGYGKTEVAMRAAFKAVCDGKQVAILVPTTILALQHYETLLSRMRGFPVAVDMLSRFRNAKQQATTLRKVARGETDIIVGTHRLLSKDIEFKDLGLVIIDEEQRFGVAQKEKLRQIAENVDTLTLTATPIPRTLNMAMSGIRDMSVLEEAPGDRFPVQSYVTEYNDIVVFDAIKRELRRGGQVFYLCNRVDVMDRRAAAIHKEIPEARIAIANGQMDKDDLSDIWHSLITGETDILVCTTIIETGVDVPNANTLIIEDADKMGLSQLHQLRGRVGRSSRRAYAYFTYPKNRVLSEIAEKRLSAIRDFTEFGAGFKVAMRDLEIRGAGNLLGAEQHGNMASVGYEMYMQLLDEAILEEKGEKKKIKLAECTVDFNVNAYIPEEYIRGSSHRLEAYKKISLIRNDEDLMDVNDEFLDRYGPMPDPVSSLINISFLRAIASRCGLSRVEYRNRTLIFYPEQIDIKAWSELCAVNNGKLLLSLGGKPYISCRVKNESFGLDIAIKLLKQYLKIIEKSS